MDLDTPEKEDAPLSSAVSDIRNDSSPSSSQPLQPQADQSSQPDLPPQSDSPLEHSSSKEVQNLPGETSTSADIMTDAEDHKIPRPASHDPSHPLTEGKASETFDKEGSPNFENEILADVNKAFKALTDRLHSEHVERAILEDAVLPYQQRLVAALQELEDLKERPKEQSTINSVQVEKIRSDLSTMRAKVIELRETKRELETRLAQRDHTIAQDAAEVARLRAETKEVPELRAKLSDAVNMHDFAMNKLSEVERTYVARTTAAEEGVRSLNAKIVELTTQLTETRCESEAFQAACDTRVNDAKQRASQATSKSAKLQVDNSKMQAYISKLETELSDTRSSTQELNKSFEDEIANMNKMLELNEERAEKAEARARDLMEELRQERELSIKREKRRLEKRSLIPHAETLLADMEEALQAKWAALEAQKVEMERARKSEMSVLASQEKLKKEKIDAQFLAEQHRKECVRLSRQVDQQADEIERLKRLLDQPRGFSQSPADASMIPRPSAGLGAPSPVMWKNSAVRRTSDEMMDIGPESTIPTHYFPSPSNQMSEDFQKSFRQLSAIREDHQHLLESLRDNRISFE